MDLQNYIGVSKSNFPNLINHKPIFPLCTYVQQSREHRRHYYYCSSSLLEKPLWEIHVSTADKDRAKTQGKNKSSRA